MSFEPVKRTDVGLIPVATLVIWLACVAVGVLGYVLPHQRPKPPTTQPEPTDAELVNVSLTEEKPPPPDQPQAINNSEVSPAPQAPAIPALPAVAAPSPAIAFALPVNAPVRVAAPGSARVVNNSTPTQVFAGEGDGNQPKPHYPDEADQAREEGTVRIDFVVADDGSIASARVTKPCDWPLLNQAALRCVREQWSFSPRMKGPHFVLIDFKQ